MQAQNTIHNIEINLKKEKERKWEHWCIGPWLWWWLLFHETSGPLLPSLELHWEFAVSGAGDL